MRNQKGVSLITLVITIIVVIILAAIALGNGATDSIGQADYAGFAQEIGELQEKVTTAIVNAKGREQTRGNTRTTEQLANFVARGAEAVISGDSGDAMWLVQSDAEALQATLINKAAAKTSIGQALPVRKVETYHGTKQEISYYVTNQGTVFCWPPFIYDGKSYVTATQTIKSGDGSELSGTDATKDGILTLMLDSNDTKIEIETKEAAITVPGMTRAKVGTSDIGTQYSKVVFYSKGNTVDMDVSGVAEGITFEDYDNTVRN